MGDHLESDKTRRTHGSFVDVGAPDKLVGLLGDMEILESEVGEEVTSAETHLESESETSETTLSWSYENAQSYISSDSEHGIYVAESDSKVEVEPEERHIFTQIRGGDLHFAPLPEKRAVNLLVGGYQSGIICTDLAREYPNATVTCMSGDLTLPKNNPSNVITTTHAVDAKWDYPEDYFDLIHLSSVQGDTINGIENSAQIIRCLKPGGYLEQQELSLSHQPLPIVDGRQDQSPDHSEQLPPFVRWTKLMKQAGLKHGRTTQLGPHLASIQKEAGLQDVSEKVFPLKCGDWSSDREQGSLSTQTVLQLVSTTNSFAIDPLTKSLGWSVEDAQRLVLDVQRDVEKNISQYGASLHVVFGRKPNKKRAGAVKTESNGGSSQPTAVPEAPDLQLDTLVASTIGASFAAAFTHWLIAREAWQ